jgi:putative transposase
MPWGLKRFQEAGCLHLLKFSCYGRTPRLGAPRGRDVFEQTLERVRRWYGFYVAGYVVMPEHVHLLITEPERAKLSLALQMLKQNVARELRDIEGGSLWAARFMISMCGLRPSGSRSCGTFIGTRWFEDR